MVQIIHEIKLEFDAGYFQQDWCNLVIRPKFGEWLYVYWLYTNCFLLKSKVWLEMNQTMLGVGHFTTISGHFFAKTEVLTVILKCPT